MKTGILLLSSFCLSIACAFGQLPRIILQPDGGGAPQVFQNADEAFAAATANDVLYFSGGAFVTGEQITIDFPVHIIGAGVHPDSTVATNSTTLTTSLPIVITTSGSNSTFTGIHIITQSSAANIQYGTSEDNDDPTGILFERCVFANSIRLNFGTFNQINNSETTINECVLRGALTGANNTVLALNRSVVSHTSDISQIDGGGLVVDHCVFFGAATITNSGNSTVRNTIFATATNSSPLYQCNNSSVSNCITSSAVFFGNSSGTINNSFLNATNIFVNEDDDDYDFTDNLQVNPASDASEGAIDGTDMGLYGSDAPAKLGWVPYNPHYIEVDIAPSTDEDGNLPVSIKVQSQTY